MNFRTLRADEIDVRLATVKNNGVSLLLYKDARCDMNILDEAVGMFNWKREHTRDNANCIVSLWDSEKGQWVSKEDTGTESYAEKEKGLASDSFKRACFNWGIGRELYTSPFIWVTSANCNIKDGKCYDKFFVSQIEYDNNKRITKLVIKNEKTHNTVFTYTQKSESGIPIETNSLVTKKEADMLRRLCEKKGLDISTVFNVPVEELTKEQYVVALKKLEEVGLRK